MKKTLLLLLIALASFSCKDFLALAPDYQISDQNFYRNQTDFETAMTGVYASIRPLFSGSTIQYIGDLTTDDAEIQWSSPSVDEMQLDQNAVTSTNTYVQNVWTTCLYTISRSNAILNRIDKVTFTDPAVQSRLTGEAKFMRALANFYLVRVFGDVPVAAETFTSPAQVAAADLSRKPQSDVYASIIDDLTAAETLLPATLNADRTKASRQTAKSLLGKVYLTQKQYELAATKLKEVIDGKTYSLVPNYATLFTNGNNNLAESIFEIEYVSGRGVGNNYSYMFTPAITSMALFTGNLQGAGRIVPTLEQFRLYAGNDARKAISVADSVPLINGKKTYNRYSLKFVDFKAVDTNDGSVAFPVLRYADVLLMYAEALNEQAKPTEALPFINAVRQRAKLTDLTGLTQADLRLAIEKERRLELFLEGHRWFDLVRTGRAKAVLNAYYASLKQNFTVEDFELLFPIPQNEINLNPAVKQNPGY